MVDKQPHLNGAYYGPSIPPPAKTYHSHGRRGVGGGGCGCCGLCCGCLECCGCFILSIIFNILITLAVILGIVALILWLIFRPNVVKFQVTDAKLTRFSLDEKSNNLHYNLAMNLSIRNPNQRLGIYYDQFETSGYYGDQRFATVNLPPFYQGHKNTTDLRAALHGQSVVLLGDGARRDLGEDLKSGIYRIDLKLRLRVRFKFWVLKSWWRIKPKIRCDLKVPLSSSNSTSGFEFQPTKCHVDF